MPSHDPAMLAATELIRRFRRRDAVAGRGDAGLPGADRALERAGRRLLPGRRGGGAGGGEGLGGALGTRRAGWAARRRARRRSRTWSRPAAGRCAAAATRPRVSRRRPRMRRRRRACARRARSCWAAPRRRSSAGRGSPTTRWAMSRATPGTCRGRRAGRAAAPAWPRRSAWARCMSAPTAAARSASRPSFCGIVGLKPTFGRVPAWPLSPFGTVAHLGPMTRTVEDAALMLTVMSRPDMRDWHALPPDGRDYRVGLEGGIAGPADRGQRDAGVGRGRSRGRARVRGGGRRAGRSRRPHRAGRPADRPAGQHLRAHLVSRRRRG